VNAGGVGVIEVFADVVCPFTHVGSRRIVAERDARDRGDVVLRCRAWPLELVNGAPLDAALVAEEVVALRDSVAPDLFEAFDPARLARTSVPALSLAAAAYRVDMATGERVSLALRTALFEDGRGLQDPAVLAAIAVDAGLGPDAAGADEDAVRAAWEEGGRRGVVGSPHYFVDGTGMFCPTLRIARDQRGLTVELDPPAFEDFVTRCLQ
jgi:predicted DsbA family dithiol-disulfide isomerase